MRDRLLRSRTHFQRLGAIARFRDSRFKMWVGLDIKVYRDSTPLQTSTQKDGMLTVLSGYDRLVTDSKERAKEGGEVTTTRRPLEENHLLQALEVERPRDYLQHQEVSHFQAPQERRLVTHPLHHPPTQSYLTSTPISCPKPTRTFLPRPPSSRRPPLTPLITTRPQLLSAAPPNLATSENRQ